MEIKSSITRFLIIYLLLSSAAFAGPGHVGSATDTFRSLVPNKDNKTAQYFLTEANRPGSDIYKELDFFRERQIQSSAQLEEKEKIPTLIKFEDIVIHFVSKEAAYSANGLDANESIEVMVPVFLKSSDGAIDVLRTIKFLCVKKSKHMIYCKRHP